MREMIDTRGRLFPPRFMENPISVPSIHLQMINGESLFLPESSRNSLICVSGSALGLESLSGIIAKLKEKKQIINIHLLNGFFRYHLLKGLTTLNLKRSENVDSNKLKQVVLRGPRPELQQLGVENSYGGYAFLVNSLGEIYWKSSGGLFPSELEQI
jgi:hypothetical protein